MCADFIYFILALRLSKMDFSLEYGKVTTKWGSSTYNGEFQDGKPHGRGIMIYKNGRKFEGNFEWGKRQGHGTITNADGNIFRGIWRDNELSGNQE